jgi:RNA polymerase sigma-70 factor (ECF subfamily)
VLYGTVLKIVHDEETAQDVLQEAFVKIWHNIGQYDTGKGRIYTWMLNIARNAAIDKLRSKGEIMKAKIQTGDDFVNNSGTSRKAELQTDTIGLRSMVASLRPEYHSIVELAYYKGYTLDEISKTLDVPLGTVKTRMRAAMKQLREKFSE